MTKEIRYYKHKYFCNHCLDRNYLIECECGCNEIIFLYDNHSTKRRFKFGHSNNGERNGNYKGGRKKHGNYWMLLLPDYFGSEKSGYINEHIYFYQEYYQCCILRWGVVHHIIPVSNDYCNNMIWNLMGMTKKQHTTLHNKFKKHIMIDKSDRKCSDPECKNPIKVYYDKKGREQWYGDEINGFRCRKCYNKWYDRNIRK